MKIEITEEGVVYCDTLTCDIWNVTPYCLENCPLQEIIRTAKQSMIN